MLTLLTMVNGRSEVKRGKSQEANPCRLQRTIDASERKIENDSDSENDNKHERENENENETGNKEGEIIRRCTGVVNNGGRASRGRASRTKAQVSAPVTVLFVQENVRRQT